MMYFVAAVGALVGFVVYRVCKGPDLDIGPGYMHRWHVIPRNRWFNVYVHKIMKDDDDRALHDHPWASVSFMLRGIMREVMDGGRRRVLLPGIVPLYRSATFKHRLEVAKGPVWTIFITGPRIREWGFWCPRGFVPWTQFVDSKDRGIKGRGCD